MMAENTIDAARYSSLVDELGYTGLNQYGGYLYEEWQSLLQGTAGRKVWREMRDNDPVVGAVLDAIENLVRQVSWDVEPASVEDQPDRKQADEDAAYLWQCMNDLDQPWVEFIAEVMTMLPYGFSLFEIVYKSRRGQMGRHPSRHLDGRLGWAKFAPRAQDTIDRWDVTPQGEVLAAIQQGPPDYREVRLPIDKCLLFRTTLRKGNPEARSILRNAWRPWLFKKRIEELEAIGIERDLAGLPVMEVPIELMYDGASADKKALLAALKKVVTQVKRDESEGLIVPQQRDDGGNKLFDFRLMSSGGSRQVNSSEVITRYNQMIATTALADFILLGHDKVGSFALASSKTHLFSLSLGARLDAVAEVFNTHAVPRLFTANASPPGRPLPTVVHGDIESQDLAELGSYISALAGAGMALFPDEALERQLLRAANLERSDESFDVHGYEEPAPASAVAPGSTDTGAVDGTPAMDTLQERIRTSLGGRSRRSVARSAGMSPSSLSGYMAGRNVPGRDAMQRLAEALGVDPAWLAGDR